MKHKLTLDQPATYKITVPGELSQNWLDWIGGIKIAIENDPHGHTTTTLTAIVDQAALQGLLRHLYSIGLPLVSVIWIETDNK